MQTTVAKPIKKTNIIPAEEGSIEDLVPKRAKWVYYLLSKNPNYENTFDLKGRIVDTPDYPPTYNVPIVSSIYWPGGKDPFGDERNRGKHLIRYYTGCTNLFMDKQPKDKETLDYYLHNEANEIRFISGRFEILGHDTLKILYMNWASFNEDSPYKTPNAKSMYKNYDAGKEKATQQQKIQRQKEAIRLADEATDEHILFHAKFLGIPFDSFDDGERDFELVKIDYQQAAMDNPERFIKTYRDKNLKIKHYIGEAVNNGSIVTNIVRGKACWANTKLPICSLPEGVVGDTLKECLIAFSEKPEGEEFCNQLKAVNQ